MNPKNGGPSQGIRNLNPYITMQSSKVEVLCLDDADIDYQINDAFIIHKIGKGITTFKYNRKLYKWLMDNISNYDFVSVHGIWQYHNYAVYKAIKNLKKNNQKVPKVIIMAHGMLDPYFQKAPDRKIKALRNELVWRITEKKAINAADCLFFTCEEELLLASTSFKGYAPKRTENVGYGIQRPPSYKDEMKLAFEEVCPEIQSKKYWLFLSRIHPKKGVDILIKAYNKLKSENVSLPELVVAGPTDSAYAKEMMRKAKKNNQIHFSGMLTGNSKWGAFYGCDAYLLPSHQENFGIAIVEAMACKKPVLITKNINIWREIESGNGGWVLDEVNVDCLKKQLLTLANTTNSAMKDTGENAYDTFQRKFEVEECASHFISVLKSLQ